MKKSKRMRKEKTDRDPDLEVSGHGHRSGGSQEHRSGQVSGQGFQKNTGQVQVSGQGVPET